MLKKINKEKFQEACEYLEKLLNKKIEWKYVKGFTEIDNKNYGFSKIWEYFIVQSKQIDRANLWEFVGVTGADNKRFVSAYGNFFKALAESNVLTVLSNDQDITDIIVVENPEVKVRPFVNWSGNTLYNLHSLDSPSVVYEDGIKIYAAEGIYIEDKYYTNPEQVTAEDIAKINLEKRRLVCLIMGAENFFKALGSEPILVDSGVDNQGNMMELLKFYDKSLEKEIKTLKVVCPSTQRIYYIYPPNQNVTNVWDAKASTFHNQKLAFRQGDVGLQFINKQNPDTPYIET